MFLFGYIPFPLIYTNEEDKRPTKKITAFSRDLSSYLMVIISKTRSVSSLHFRMIFLCPYLFFMSLVHGLSGCTEQGYD